MLKALPYVAGIFAVVGGGIKWLYGQLREERDRYFELYQQKEAEVEELEKKMNRKDIEIIKLKASIKKEDSNNDSY